MPSLRLSAVDFSKESTGVTISTPGQLSPANVEAYDVGTPASQGKLLMDAIKAISNLTWVWAFASDKQPVDALTYPTDPEAKRESKLLVSYIDSTFGRVHTQEIPGYNNVGVVPNSEDVDLADPDIAEFVTRFEAYAGPDGGTRTVISAKSVSRNL